MYTGYKGVNFLGFIRHLRIKININKKEKLINLPINNKMLQKHVYGFL